MDDLSPVGTKPDDIFEAFDRERKPAAEKVEQVAKTVQTRGKPLILAPGFFPEITPAQYFAEPCAAPALTNSGIKLLAPAGAAPAKFAHQHPAIGQAPEEIASTAAQYRGRLVHRLSLDKGDDYAISPFDEYRSNDAKAWKADTEARGVMPVKRAAFEEAEAMAAIVRERIVEACEGRPYQTEVVIAWQEKVELRDGTALLVWCRAMLDVWCPDLLLALDVKTCADACDDAIVRQFANGYATQDGWYLRGLNRLTGETGRARFGFLFVESEAPFLYRPVASTEAFRHGANMEIERALSVFGQCLNADDWPGYADLRVLPPSWLLQRWTAAEMMELAS